MKAQAFRDWLKALPTLTAKQRGLVEAALHQASPERLAEGIVNRRANEVHACPHATPAR